MTKKSPARSKKTRAAAKAAPTKTKAKKTVAKKAPARKRRAPKPAAKTVRKGPPTRTTSVVAWPGLPPGYFDRVR